MLGAFYSLALAAYAGLIYRSLKQRELERMVEETRQGAKDLAERVNESAYRRCVSKDVLRDAVHSLRSLERRVKPEVAISRSFGKRIRELAQSRYGDDDLFVFSKIAR